MLDDPLLVQALLVLPALALAAGVDLYLTLLLLGLAPATGFWEGLPGALGDLASPGVILLTGAFYLAELTADRGFATSLVWHGLHAIIRPLAGALLALLVLDGGPTAAVAGGAILAALLASAAHAAVTGGSLLLRLDRSPPAAPALVSLAEDVGVLALLTLALDRPGWGTAAAGVLVVGALPAVGSPLRAFVFSVRLAVGRIRRILTGGGWTRPDDLPRWVRRALAHETMAPGGLRGTPAAGIGLPGRPRLVLGWVGQGRDPTLRPRPRPWAAGGPGPPPSPIPPGGYLPPPGGPGASRRPGGRGERAPTGPPPAPGRALAGDPPLRVPAGLRPRRPPCTPCSDLPRKAGSRPEPGCSEEGRGPTTEEVPGTATIGQSSPIQRFDRGNTLL